jgi:choice-of-anchor A domain-containing protein/uncharacterized repeat protein (TIGR01451 family)
MKKGNLFFNLLLITLIFVSSAFANVGDNYSTINGNKFKDIKSTTATPTGTDKGETVHFSSPVVYNNFAGTFKGNVDGTPANFYCIDLHHYVQWNVDYVVDGNTSPEITYVLNNYYPYKAYTGTNGELDTEQKEAAAVQSAVWHFADGLDLDEAANPGDPNNFTPDEIRIRAKAIVDAAENANDVPVTTLVIDPVSQNILSGTDAVFYVEAYNENNSPVAGVTVTVETTSDGVLSPLTLDTDASGIAGPFTLSHANDNSAVIKATAITVVPQGTRYVHKDNPDGKQKLVLATPSLVEKDVESTITWFDATDIVVVKTVSNDNPDDEETVTYTITVTNNGSVDGTGITVADILPNGLNFQSASSNAYDEMTGIWTIGDLSAGASTSLDITVEVDYQSLSVTPIADFGEATGYNLFVLKDATQPSSDTQGKVAVGRNAKFGSYSIGDQLPQSNGTEDVLVVGRKITYTSGQVYGGNVIYGKYKDIQQTDLCSDGTIRKADPNNGDPLPVDFALAKTELLALSSQLGAYPANGTTTFEYSGLTLNGNNPVLNVFDVDGNELSSANSMEINVPNGSVVLVNVSRYNVTWSGGLVVNGTGIGNVIYNFYKSGKLKIQGIDIQGTILAPKAKVNFVTGVIHGQMICNFYEGQGQMNLAPFHGLIPGNPEITNCAELLNVDQPEVDSTNNSSCALLTVNTNVDPTGNNGTEWVETSGLGIQEIIWSNYSGSNGMLVGTVGGKIYQAGANGWERINPDMSVGYIWSLYEDANFIYAGTEQGLFKFDGTDWTKLDYDVDVRAITGIGNTLYAAVWGQGIYSSDDNGASWSLMNAGLELSGYAVQTLTVSNGVLFVGTLNIGVFKYNSNDSVWESVDIGYDYIWNLDADDVGHIFAATSGGGVYASTDFGETWASVNSGIPALHIYTVGIYGNNVFVSTYLGGIYKFDITTLAKSNNSTLADNAWESVGMTGIEVTSVMFDDATQTLYAATSDGTVYKMIDGTTSVDNDGFAPAEFALDQNYPNPFNPSTKIDFSIAEAGQYAVKVFNVLGQEVATFANQDFSTGKYTFNFDASNLTSGIYFYKLVGENVNLTKKMMLLK